MKFCIRGIQLCHKSWKTILGIDHNILSKVLQSFKMGLNDLPVDEIKRENFSFGGHKTHVARAWLDNYVQHSGEKLPLRSQIALPSYLTKLKVYEAMKADVSNVNNPVLSYSKFCKLWKEEFSFVIIPPVRIFV